VLFAILLALCLQVAVHFVWLYIDSVTEWVYSSLSVCFGGSVSCTCCKSMIAHRGKAKAIIMQRALLGRLCKGADSQNIRCYAQQGSLASLKELDIRHAQGHQ